MRFLGSRPVPLAVVLLLVIALVFPGGGAPALAEKPAAVVQWSNGYPSGEHFNLNIHGKKPNFSCDPTSGGGSVFVPEYGTAEIDYVQNKRSSVTELTVRDPCAGFDGDPALVQLPAGEYQVYARILAKPHKSGEPREVVFYPKLVEACNDTGSDTFGDAVDCSGSFLLGTGVITSGGVFDLESQTLIRSTGKSKAVDVTALFQWSGYACDQAYDTNGNGEIDLGDLPTADLDGDGFMDGDLDKDGDLDQADLDLYLAANCTQFTNEWVFNIADLVVYGWDYQNNGSKLLQVRFYPLSTTQFE
ncbi:MAG: hypothetical protein HYY01_02005 [Chloroflexi bacterium]|nr:hypothetical protein [Chloroflexota bacterium]